MDPWPVAFTMRDGQPLKLFGARPSTYPLGKHGGGHGGSHAPGTVVAVDRDGLHVAAVDAAVCIGEVQPAGKRRMSASAWASGQPAVVGSTLSLRSPDKCPG
jgi:methionyl-tRNA formyltransferase